MTGATGEKNLASEAPVLEKAGLAVGHGARSLVSGIDLSVRPGQIVALIGPNGSGKTTILRTVAGQLAPRAGVVWIAGRDLREPPAPSAPSSAPRSSPTDCAQSS